MEESGFRGAGDLSAPWLRHFGRDDRGGVGPFGRDDRRVVAPSVEMTVGVLAPSVEMTVGCWPLRL